MLACQAGGRPRAYRIAGIRESLFLHPRTKPGAAMKFEMTPLMMAGSATAALAGVLLFAMLTQLRQATAVLWRLAESVIEEWAAKRPHNRELLRLVKSELAKNQVDATMRIDTGSNALGLCLAPRDAMRRSARREGSRQWPG